MGKAAARIKNCLSVTAGLLMCAFVVPPAMAIVLSVVAFFVFWFSAIWAVLFGFEEEWRELCNWILSSAPGECVDLNEH